MWSNISGKAKQLSYHIKNRGGNISQIKYYTYNHNYYRKHQKFAKLIILHNRTRNSEKISPIVMQNWHFLKCHSNCSTNKCKLLIHKISKQQLTAHTSIVKEDRTKCYKHVTFSSNALLCSLVLKI